MTAFRRGEGIRIGGPRDPVAQSIRAEQQRNAAPTHADARKEHRRVLSTKGCLVCDVDDPDRLRWVQVPRQFCQHCRPGRDPYDDVVLCDEHERSAATLRRAHMVQQGRQQDADVIALYDCGVVRYASWTGTVPDGPGFEDVDDVSDLSMRGKERVGADPPLIPAFHAHRGCGGELDETIRLGD